MVQKLSVQIQLEGAQEIERQLAGIGKAGQQCFADIQTAAQKTGGFDKLNPSIVADKFKQFGITVPADIKKITAAVAQAGKLEGMVSGVANLERGTQKLSAAANTATAAFGLTRREIGALSRALRAIDLGQLGSQLALIGRVGGAFGPVGIAITAIGVAVAGAAAALVKFAVDASEAEKTLTQLQKVSGVSFENLSALQQVFAAGGTPLQQFASEFGNLSEKIADAGQQAKIAKAEPAWVEWANDVDMVRKKFNDLNVGAFSALTTTDTKVKALTQSLAKLGGQDRLFRLADVFKNLGSDLERAQLGKALSLSPTFITTLTQGGDALRQMEVEAQRLGLTLTTSNQTALQQMAAQWNQFVSLFSAFFQKIGAIAAPAIGQILAGFSTAMQEIITDFQNLPLDQAIANIGNRLAPAFTQLGNVLSPLLSQIGSALGEALVAGIIAAVKARLGGRSGDTMGPLQPGSAGFESRAGGGLLGGSGTGTSDSNLAWVSRGEHIMPARAVRQPGVLALLEALRRSGGNLSAVLNGMGHFALGGMVPRAMPAFASGGLAGGMSNVTIAFPGLPPVSGLRASSAVVDELRKSAALAQVRSGGRKPSRYA